MMTVRVLGNQNDVQTLAKWLNQLQVNLRFMNPDGSYADVGDTGKHGQLLLDPVPPDAPPRICMLLLTADQQPEQRCPHAINMDSTVWEIHDLADRYQAYAKAEYERQHPEDYPRG